jgi:hypothetical protein
VIRKLISAAAIATMAGAGLGAVPASAQDYSGRDSYHQNDDRDDRGDYRDDRDQDARYQNYRQQQDDYRRYQEQRSRAQYQDQYRGYASDGYAHDYRDGYRQPQYRQRRCSSGTTGTIIGGVFGALLGREVGRGGPYNEPSTTGAILGAGGGALAGRAIERSGCR